MLIASAHAQQSPYVCTDFSCHSLCQQAWDRFELGTATYDGICYQFCIEGGGLLGGTGEQACTYTKDQCLSQTTDPALCQSHYDLCLSLLPTYCTCGNGVCEVENGEPGACLADCTQQQDVCGDGVCGSSEDTLKCPQDCGGAGQCIPHSPCQDDSMCGQGNCQTGQGFCELSGMNCNQDTECINRVQSCIIKEGQCVLDNSPCTTDSQCKDRGSGDYCIATTPGFCEFDPAQTCTFSNDCNRILDHCRLDVGFCECEPTGPVCGDNVCEPGEELSCAQDCNLPSDEDHDGVLDEFDLCPASTIDMIDLNPNQYAQNQQSAAFESGPNNDQSIVFTMQNTNGCTCRQIAEQLGIGAGNIKKGCSPGIMQVFTGIDHQPDRDAGIGKNNDNLITGGAVSTPSRFGMTSPFAVGFLGLLAIFGLVVVDLKNQ